MSDTGSPRPVYRPVRRRSPLRRTLSIVVVIAIAAILAVILTFCATHGAGQGGGGGRGGRGGAGGAFARPAITVGVAKAQAGDIPIVVNALGTVTPLATVSVNARVSGQLVRVAFREGQTVRRGQLLAQIDPRPFQVALQQAQGQLAHDQALLADARLDLARYRTLHAQDSIAGQTLDTQTALVRQDEATVLSDQGMVGSARLNLEFTHIAAPISGRVGLRQIDPGNQITANQTTPFTVVTEMDPITVVFSVPESQIGPIQKAGAAGLPTAALDRAGGAVLAEGRLATLDNLIDTTTGTVKARASFRNPNGALFPNQFVNVSLLVDTLRNQIVVPTTAVRHGPQGDFVWLVQPGQTVTARLVKVGPGTPETVSIVSGLALGDTVITDGGDRLKEGSKVVLPGQNPVAGGGKRPGGGWRGSGHGGGHRRGRGGQGGAQGDGGGQDSG